MQNAFQDKNYMSLCSEKTLQSNDKGFFMDFAGHVAESAGSNWIKNVFSKITTDTQRIRIVYQYEPVKNIILEVFANVQEIYRKKDADVSQSKRLEAENLLKSGQSEKAVIIFSQSVLRAPKTTENKKIDCGLSLALALYGRSQAFIALEKYSWALKDIQLALKENLSNVYKAEAYWKMAICYRALQNDDKANVAFNLAEKLLQSQAKIDELHLDKNKEFKEKETINRREVPNVAGNCHKDFQNASGKILVKQQEKLGRFVVANEEIRTGETLVVETSYGSCLLPEMFGTHCHHCFDRLIAPVGCSNCCSVAFCTVECKNAGETYHKWECKFLDLLIGSGMSILAHTALRIVTQNSLETNLEIYKNRHKERIFSLCTNSHMRPAEDFLQRTLMAAFLLRVLQKSGYFQKDNQNIIPSEEELKIGEMLLFYLQMLQFNAHEIYETRHHPGHRFRDSKTAYIGVAIYPTVALFNHDCYPAVTRHFVGKQIVIKSSRPLAPGDVIAENYGPLFTRKTLKDRQRSLLARYWFTCQCKACTLNWPTLETGLDTVSRQIKCPVKKCNNYFTLPLTKSKIKCPKCKKDVELSKQEEQLIWCEGQYELGFQAMDSENPELAITILCKAIDVFHQISQPPHKGTHLAQETLRACVADFGNVYNCLSG